MSAYESDRWLKAFYAAVFIVAVVAFVLGAAVVGLLWLVIR